MEATTGRTQSLFPAKFLFATTREQMNALDDLTTSIPGADRLTVARAALTIGLAYIEATGVAPLTAEASRRAAMEMTNDTTNTFTIPVDALAELLPVAGAAPSGRAH